MFNERPTKTKRKEYISGEMHNITQFIRHEPEIWRHLDYIKQKIFLPCYVCDTLNFTPSIQGGPRTIKFNVALEPLSTKNYNVISAIASGDLVDDIEQAIGKGIFGKGTRINIVGYFVAQTNKDKIANGCTRKWDKDKVVYCSKIDIKENGKPFLNVCIC